MPSHGAAKRAEILVARRLQRIIPEQSVCPDAGEEDSQMKKLVTCPKRGHLEEIEFRISPVDGRILGIASCSAFKKESWVDCDEQCVKLLNQKLAAKGHLSTAPPRSDVTATGD